MMVLSDPETGSSHEFTACLVFIITSMPARATMRRCLRKEKKNNKQIKNKLW